MRTKRWRRISQALALAVLLLALALPQTWAAGPASTVRDKFRSGNSVVIPATETIPHDLYVVGSTVRIDGRIDGDLFVAGGTVDVSGPVSGDLFVAGGTVTISSPVERHLRVAGGNVTVSGPVRLDLLAAAGTLTVSSAARVGEDVIFTAGTMVLNGSVEGSVLGSAQTYTKGGTVGGGEEVTLNQQQPKQARTPSVASRVLGEIQRYLGIVLVGALLLWLAPRLIQPIAAQLRERPLPSLGFGALGFVGFFAVLIGLFIGMVVLAIPLGLLGLGRVALALLLGVLLGTGVLWYLFMLVLLFGAAVVVGLAIGKPALSRVEAPWAASPYAALLLGVFVVVALTAIPVLGWLLEALVVLLGLGALVLQFWQRRGAPAATPASMPGGGMHQPVPLT